MLCWLHCVASLSVGVHLVALVSSPIGSNTKIWLVLVFVPLANEIRAQSVSAIRAPAQCQTLQLGQEGRVNMYFRSGQTIWVTGSRAGELMW